MYEIWDVKKSECKRLYKQQSAVTRWQRQSSSMTVLWLAGLILTTRRPPLPLSSHCNSVIDHVTISGKQFSPTSYRNTIIFNSVGAAVSAAHVVTPSLIGNAAKCVCVTHLLVWSTAHSTRPTDSGARHFGHKTLRHQHISAPHNWCRSVRILRAQTTYTLRHQV